MNISQLSHLNPLFLRTTQQHANNFNLDFKHEDPSCLDEQIETRTASTIDNSLPSPHPFEIPLNQMRTHEFVDFNLDFKHEDPSWLDGQIETLTASTIDNNSLPSPYSFEIPLNQMPFSQISRSHVEVHNNIIDQDYTDQIKFTEGTPPFGVGNICNGELYNTETMMDEFANQPITSSCSSSSAPVKKKKKPQWTVDEHKLFILGLKKYGKGDWKSISRNYVTTRSSTQVASHAQKYFNRREKNTRRKRSSIHDIVNVDDDSIVALVGKGLLSPDKALSFRTLSNTQLVSHPRHQHHVQLHPHIDETNIAREALLMCQSYPDYCGTNASSSSRFETQQTRDPPHQLQWGPLPPPQWP